jgi:uncharacterized protein YhfF
VATDSCAELWAAFLASGSAAALDARDAGYDSWQFGYGREQGDRLLDCVISGPKRATAGALATYEHDRDPVPSAGDFSVVTDGSGIARCVIRTTSVAVVPFECVDADFAFDEGEGDRSLGYWRSVHWDYFSKELAQFGQSASPGMPVVCERFELVFVDRRPLA